MRTKRVTETWEYYRDNCSGFKEPMRKRFRELDERIVALEELCADMHHYCDTLCTECEFVNGICDGEGASECMLFIRIEQRMDELGIPRGQ